jgi:hypothetical protein
MAGRPRRARAAAVLGASPGASSETAAMTVTAIAAPSALAQIPG